MLAPCLSSPKDYQLSNALLPKINMSWLKENHPGEGSNILFPLHQNSLKALSCPSCVPMFDLPKEVLPCKSHPLREALGEQPQAS